MSKPRPPARQRHLSTEDEQLWEHTASSLEPLKTRKGRHHAAVQDPEQIEPFLATPKPAKAPAKPLKQTDLATAPASVRPSAPPPDFNAFDRKAARKLRQGRAEIEARIDLHGMRQHEAHAALRRFLFASVAKERRWVLVITGKGGTKRTREDDDYMGASERGILRRNVPIWLSEPELRAIVVSYTGAAIQHGGEGALYVQLRKPDRVR